MKPKMPDSRKPKPGLWPPGRPRATQSRAEQKVYEALSTGLPKGWYAWHSLRIRRGGCTETEIDFIVADPSQGILIVEVKGGRMEEREGLWYSNGQLLEQAPREQANRFRHELIELLLSRDILLPPCGIATFFPDTEFGKQPGQSDMAGCVLGKQDLPWLADALPDLMKRALPKGYKPKGNWIGAIHSLWGETWIPKFDFGLHRRLEEEERLRLGNEQFVVLQGLMENRSLLVEGAAGTGKTVLAMETARRLAADGKQVLVLCFTEPLACWLAVSASSASCSSPQLSNSLPYRSQLPGSSG